MLYFTLFIYLFNVPAAIHVPLSTHSLFCFFKYKLQEYQKGGDGNPIVNSLPLHPYLKKWNLIERDLAKALTSAIWTVILLRPQSWCGKRE